MALTIDETPARPGEWGFRPQDVTTEETPPAFVWRPQAHAASYDIQCARVADFSKIEYEARGVRYTAHRPAEVFALGQWYWRFRFADREGRVSNWSSGRGFAIAQGAKALPLPKRGELIGRIPKSHPRLFVRPDQLGDLRARAQGDLKPIYDDLVATCEDILTDVPPTEEPPLYPEGTVRLSEAWREIWWGNRMYTIRVLNSAATLAFTRLLGGQNHYGEKAKELLLACAQWDPLGATGYRYNDEAGMPYNYYFSRTYSFVNDLLREEERELCREVMRVQGREMCDHLATEMQYLWHPYGSHAGRAWHFLGEIGIAFLDEIPEAEEWVWFAMNVFAAVYPAWCDEDGGWHQGLQYWASYVQRFTWWADIMHAAMGIDAYRKPYFARAGDLPMYFQPPGTRGGGGGRFDDHENIRSKLRFDEHTGGAGAQPILAMVRGSASKGRKSRKCRRAFECCRRRAVALYRLCAGRIAQGGRQSTGGFAHFKVFSRHGVGGDEYGFDGWREQCGGHF